MNRRNFVLAGTAGLSLLASSAAAYQRAGNSTVLVSELTDAEIDFTSSGFELKSQAMKPITEDTGEGFWENITLLSGLGDIEFDFISLGILDIPLYVTKLSMGFQAMSAVEHAFEKFETGGFLVLSFDAKVSYLEYQLGALPTADLIITITTKQSAFREELAKTQTIMVGGAPPYLFIAESGVETLEFGEAAAVTAVPSRSSRSTTVTNTTNAASTSAASTSGTPEEFVGEISARRAIFLESFGTFVTHLGTVQTGTDAEGDIAFDLMNDIALAWQAYPADAQALSTPPGMESLGALYGEWAGVIGKMGTLFEELYMGADTIDAFIAAMDTWETLDEDLADALASQVGTISAPRMLSSRSLVAGMHATTRFLA